MKKQFLGYSRKEVDVLLEVLRNENEDLKRQIMKMDFELSRQKAESNYLKSYYKELQSAGSSSQGIPDDESEQPDCEILYISKEG